LRVLNTDIETNSYSMLFSHCVAHAYRRCCILKI